MPITASRLSRAAIALVATTWMVASAGALGCGSQCDRHPDEAPVPYRQGITNRDAGTYYTSSEAGPFLPFPPGRTYRLFHGLTGVPQLFNAYLSFDEYPGPGGGFVESAGNQVTYETVNATYVDVRNDTCSDVHIRVFLSDPAPEAVPDAGPAPDAAGDGG